MLYYFVWSETLLSSPLSLWINICLLLYFIFQFSNSCEFAPFNLKIGVACCISDRYFHHLSKSFTPQNNIIAGVSNGNKPQITSFFRFQKKKKRAKKVSVHLVRSQYVGNKSRVEDRQSRSFQSTSCAPWWVIADPRFVGTCGYSSLFLKTIFGFVGFFSFSRNVSQTRFSDLLDLYLEPLFGPRYWTKSRAIK